ncbi:MAG: OmpA family protein [Planctomycetes bacterium]|nr:OmpA family protein [Planctomycetota bacterium]
MIRKTAAVLSLAAAAAFGAVGCSSGPDLKARCEELGRENEDLQRRNTQLEGQLSASEAKVQAMERETSSRRNGPMRSGEKTNEYPLPEDLGRNGISVRGRGNETVIELPSDLFFASGSATLSAGGEKALASVCAMLRKQYPAGLIRIDGHTDSDPIRKTKNRFHCNFDLGFERAHQVAHYLVDRGGVDPHRIVCETFGANLPRDSKNKAKNRRVEIVIARGG